VAAGVVRVEVERAAAVEALGDELVLVGQLTTDVALQREFSGHD
jgi:hypothetical protein